MPGRRIKADWWELIKVALSDSPSLTTLELGEKLGIKRDSIANSVKPYIMDGVLLTRVVLYKRIKKSIYYLPSIDRVFQIKKVSKLDTYYEQGW